MDFLAGKSRSDIVLNRSLILIVCILISIGFRMLTVVFQLPVRLGFVGSFLAAYMVGPAVVVITSIIPYVALSVVESTAIFFTVPCALSSLLMYFLIHNRKLKQAPRYLLLYAFLVGIFFSVISIPGRIIIADPYNDNILEYMLFHRLTTDMHMSEKMAYLICNLGLDVLDVEVSFLIVFVTVYFITAFKSREFSYVFRKSAVIAVIALSFIIILSFNLTSRLNSDTVAEHFDSSRTEVRTDTHRNEPPVCNSSPIFYSLSVLGGESGLLAAEANDVAETEDGLIWIGSNSGLTEYDGSRCEVIDNDILYNITCIETDGNNSWFGTCDRGIVLLDEEGYHHFTAAEVLGSNSVTRLAKGRDGLLYIGTRGYLCTLGWHGLIQPVTKDIQYITSVDRYRSGVIVTDREGELCYVSDGEIRSMRRPDTEGVSYTFAAARDSLAYAGRSDGNIDIFTFENGRLTLTGRLESATRQPINCIECPDGELIYFSTNNYVGIVSADANVRTRHMHEFFDIKSIHRDYQGNIWVSSPKCGVGILTEEIFVDIFPLIDRQSERINAVHISGSLCYCAGEKGVSAFNIYSGKKVSNYITDGLSNTHVWQIFGDSAGNVWFLSDSGTVRVGKDGGITSMAENEDLKGSGFRCMTELGDGKYAVGSSDGGVSIIENDNAVAFIGKESGLSNDTILCIAKDGKGRIIAGTDGGGINIIDSRYNVKNLTCNQGLDSDIVKRIVRYVRDGKEAFFIVTESGLCIMKNDEISKIESIRNHDVYDILMVKDQAYIVCGSGIYRADAGELAEDRVSYAEYFGKGADFEGNPVNYSENEVYGSTLLLCTDSGLVSHDVNYPGQDRKVPLKLGIKVYADWQRVEERDGVSSVDIGYDNLFIVPSVRNYTSRDNLVRFYIENMGSVQLQKESDLVPMTVFKPEAGIYRVWIDVYDRFGQKVVQSQYFEVEKTEQLWHAQWYKVFYVQMVGLWHVMYILFMLYLLFGQDEKRYLALKKMEEEMGIKVN